MRRILINSHLIWTMFVSRSASVHVCPFGEREARKEETNSEKIPHSRGIALVLALIMLSVLVVLIGQFQYSANVDARIAENYAADRENYYAARGALNLAIALLIKDAKDADKSKTDTLTDDWADSDMLKGLSIGGVSTVTEVKDQERFLNINRLSKRENPGCTDQEYQRIKDWIKDSLRRLIVEILQLDQTNELQLAERISDWIDEDGDGSYEEGARNMPLTTIEEMLQIPEMTKSILYGHTDEEGEEHEGLASYITLWGTGKVNINTAPSKVLLAISQHMMEDDVTAILNYREDTGNHPQGFGAPGNLKEATNILTRQDNGDPQLLGHLTCSSTFFEVSILASKGYLKMQVEAIVERRGTSINQLFWKERQASKLLSPAFGII
jgi:general secretion pathway protein K